jgi:hypothetical protein
LSAGSRSLRSSTRSGRCRTLPGKFLFLFFALFCQVFPSGCFSDSFSFLSF